MSFQNSNKVIGRSSLLTVKLRKSLIFLLMVGLRCLRNISLVVFTYGWNSVRCRVLTVENGFGLFYGSPIWKLDLVFFTYGSSGPGTNRLVLGTVVPQGASEKCLWFFFYWFGSPHRKEKGRAESEETSVSSKKDASLGNDSGCNGLSWRLRRDRRQDLATGSDIVSKCVLRSCACFCLISGHIIVVWKGRRNPKHNATICCMRSYLSYCEIGNRLATGSCHPVSRIGDFLRGGWVTAGGGGFSHRREKYLFVRSGAVTPRPSRECDIAFVKGGPKSAQQFRDSTLYQWRRAGCRASPYRHPGWHTNVVPPG